MSKQKNLPNIPSATSLQESADGHLHCNSRDSHQIDLFGLEVAPVNHSAVPVSKKAKKTNGICGRCGSDLSVNPDRQLCLENRCQPQYAIIGGMMWPMIWKEKVTPRGRKLGQLIVSAHPISGTDYGLWLTPRASEVVEPAGQAAKRLGDRRPETACSLGEQVTSAAMWATPNTMDGMGDRSLEAMKRQFETTRKGRTAPANLREQVNPAMWPSPTVRDYKDTGDLSNSMERKDGKTRLDCVPRIAFGIEAQNNGLTAQMENKGSLNPQFVYWLMGFPKEWVLSAQAGMQSYQRSRRGSSKKVV